MELSGKELWSQFREKFSSDGVSLSSFSSYALKVDMKHFLFVLSRYKMVMKMFGNRKNLSILELGCNDGLGALMLRQTGACKSVLGVDFDSDSIKWAKQNLGDDILEFIEDDFMGKRYDEADVVFSLDVIEHIDNSREDEFIETIVENLKPSGFAVIGTPNIQMYQYTSELNKRAHINNYSQERLQKLLEKYFYNVFIFGMNDEVLHTGFHPMVSYIMVLCCNKKVNPS